MMPMSRTCSCMGFLGGAAGLPKAPGGVWPRTGRKCLGRRGGRANKSRCAGAGCARAPGRPWLGPMTTPRALLGAVALAACACAAAPAPDAPQAQLSRLASGAEAELRGNILPFWLKHARDREHGGFHAFIGEDMSVRDDPAPHGALLTSRILWTFSAAYRLYRDPDYLEMAR